MSTREQFGKYLLLKKLTEDPLGESFRAGMLSDKGMERVVLLRVWNGQGLDGERLWQACASRAALQRALRSPNIGEGIEMGAVQGIPYVAYDYISGRNLATLMEQAAAKASPIPTEHALLITERVALALALAAEHRFDGERIRHGFVVPHLVMLSNEGESRLLGFEMGPALRMFAASPVIRQHFGRYLAPEAMAGAELHRADDTYSLGVLLYELLTGTALPPPAVDGYGSIVEGAILATGGEVPEPLRQLMRHSLAPRDQRIADVVAWHKALNTWMLEGYNPTTFNLAFFMHNLFRQEIELESEEIEVEKTMPLPVMTPAAAPSPAFAPPTPPTAGGLDTVEVMPPLPAEAAPEPVAESKGGGKIGLWLALAALLLAAIGAGGWYYMQQRAAVVPPPVVAAPPPPPPPPPPVELMGPPVPEELLAQGENGEGTPAEDRMELQAKIDELVDERASALETELRAKMDQQLSALRQQLDSAQKTAAERGEELRQRQAADDADGSPAAGVVGAAAERGDPPVGSAETPPAATGSADVASAATDPTATDPSATDPADVASTGAADVVETDDVAPAEELAPPPPPTPRVRRGDLVEPGHPGLVPPQRLRTPPVRFPELARRAKKTGVEVLIKVLVDENGKVIDSQLQGQKAGYGFDGEALKVARRTTYEPARVGNVPVKMWVTMRVKFQ